MLQARVLWGMLPLRALAIRVVSKWGPEHQEGPWHGYSPWVMTDLYDRLRMCGDPAEKRSTSIAGFPGQWLVFFEPSTLRVPEVPASVSRGAPPAAVSGASASQQTVAEATKARRVRRPAPYKPKLPEGVAPPADMTHSGQRGAWEYGYWAGRQGKSEHDCPYNERVGSSSYRHAWLSGWRTGHEDLVRRAGEPAQVAG